MIFIKETEGFTFVNSTSIYSCSSGYEVGSQKLSNDTHIALSWFGINIMFANVWENSNNVFLIGNWWYENYYNGGKQAIKSQSGA